VELFFLSLFLSLFHLLMSDLVLSFFFLSFPSFSHSHHPHSGIMFHYSLEPISVKIKEFQQSYLHTLTRVCGLIGGVFVTAGISFVSFFVFKKNFILCPEPILSLLLLRSCPPNPAHCGWHSLAKEEGIEEWKKRKKKEKKRKKKFLFF